MWVFQSLPPAPAHLLLVPVGGEQLYRNWAVDKSSSHAGQWNKACRPNIGIINGGKGQASTMRFLILLLKPAWGRPLPRLCSCVCQRRPAGYKGPRPPAPSISTEPLPFSTVQDLTDSLRIFKVMPTPSSSPSIPTPPLSLSFYFFSETTPMPSSPLPPGRSAGPSHAGADTTGGFGGSCI